MPFIGNQPADKFLSLEKQVFTTSATDTYVLDREVSSVNDIELFLNNVRQEPTEAYTISGTTLTLASAITASDSMYCIYQGRAVGTQSPAIGSVTNDMLAGSIATSKLADITANGITMADMWRLNTTFQNVGSTATLLSSNLEQVDTGSFGGIGTGMSESSGTFTFPQTGIYLIIFQVQGRADGGARTSIGGRIKVSEDGGTNYTTRTHGYDSGYGNVANGSSTLLHMLDVTSTTNIKVQFFVQSSDTTYFDAETSASYNSMTFIRLGDT